MINTFQPVWLEIASAAIWRVQGSLSIALGLSENSTTPLRNHLPLETFVSINGTSIRRTCVPHLQAMFLDFLLDLGCFLFIQFPGYVVLDFKPGYLWLLPFGYSTQVLLPCFLDVGLELTVLEFV